MTKVIHSDFLICFKEMSSAFSAIEKIQAWALMSYLVPEVGTLFVHAPERIEPKLHRNRIWEDQEKSQIKSWTCF